MNFPGKGMALGGTIVSAVFSFFGFIGCAAFNAMAKTQEFIDGYNEGFLESDPTLTLADAEASLDVILGVVTFFQYSSLIFLVLGIIALIFVIIVKPSSVKGIGIYLLILSILHIMTGRILAFVLLLMGSIKFIQYKPEIKQPEVNEVPVF